MKINLNEIITEKIKNMKNQNEPTLIFGLKKSNLRMIKFWLMIVVYAAATIYVFRDDTSIILSGLTQKHYLPTLMIVLTIAMIFFSLKEREALEEGKLPPPPLGIEGYKHFLSKTTSGKIFLALMLTMIAFFLTEIFKI